METAVVLAACLAGAKAAAEAMREAMITDFMIFVSKRNCEKVVSNSEKRID
jgi:hypothetical protein